MVQKKEHGGNGSRIGDIVLRLDVGGIGLRVEVRIIGLEAREWSLMRHKKKIY